MGLTIEITIPAPACPNRAADYVRDIERWTCHARGWLKAGDLRGAQEALAECSEALKSATAYIETGVEQYPQAVNCG